MSMRSDTDLVLCEQDVSPGAREVEFGRRIALVNVASGPREP